MSDFFVMLLFKTVIYKSKLLILKNAQVLNSNILNQTQTL